MNLRHYNVEDLKVIVELFTSAFADSEGESEGTLIGKLAEDLFVTTDERDIFNYVAEDDGQIVGSIFFTRITVEDNLDSFILAPVAVRSDRQGNGIGQALISHGLTDLKDRGVSTVLTYGDPAFYQKVGFHQISDTIVKAPFELSQPEGWLGQSLRDDSIELLSGRCTCVKALNNPVYW